MDSSTIPAKIPRLSCAANAESLDDMRVTASESLQQVLWLKLPKRQRIKVLCNVDEDPDEVASRVVMENDLPSDYSLFIAEWFRCHAQTDDDLCAGVESSIFFECVPAVVWAKISRNLNLADLFRLELVNKRFAALAQTVWKSTRFNSFDFSDLIHFDLSSGVHTTNDFHCYQLHSLLARVGEVVEELSFSAPGPAEFSDEKQDEEYGRTETVYCISEKLVVEIVNQASHLKRLKFFGSKLTPAAMILLGRITSLECLSLIRTDVSLDAGEIPDEIQPFSELDSDRLSTTFEESLRRALAPLTLLKELRVAAHTRFRCNSYIPPYSTTVLDSVNSQALRILEIGVCITGVVDLCNFARTHTELVEFSVDSPGGWKLGHLLEDGAEPVSIVRSLVENCPHLKRLDLKYVCMLGDAVRDDAHLLRDLDSLTLQCIPELTDDDVIAICERNTTARKFEIRSTVVTNRAFLEGLSLLHHLETFNTKFEERIDDRAFEAVIRASSATLRFVDIDDPSLLTVAALGSLGFHCAALEKLTFAMSPSALAGPVAWASVAAMGEFAKAVAASPQRSTKKKVRVEIGLAEDLQPPEDLLVTGLVTVVVRGGETFEY